MSGTLLGSSITLPVSRTSFGQGVASFTVEMNRDYYLHETVLEPYGELGASYQFVRPNNGQILTSNLLLASTSPWSGIARLGGRAVITRSLFLEASIANLSIGQGSYHLWEGKLYLSYSF